MREWGVWTMLVSYSKTIEGSHCRKGQSGCSSHQVISFATARDSNVIFCFLAGMLPKMLRLLRLQRDVSLSLALTSLFWHIQCTDFQSGLSFGRWKHTAQAAELVSWKTAKSLLNIANKGVTAIRLRSSLSIPHIEYRHKNFDSTAKCILDLVTAHHCSNKYFLYF